MLEVADIFRLHGAAYRARFGDRLLPSHQRASGSLVPVEALSVIFRAKLCAALKKAKLLEQAPPQVWKKDWVVHCQPAGSGRTVLDYLGRYVSRIAITNSRLEQIDNGQVTFRYRHSRS